MSGRLLGTLWYSLTEVSSQQYGSVSMVRWNKYLHGSVVLSKSFMTLKEYVIFVLFSIQFSDYGAIKYNL